MAKNITIREGDTAKQFTAKKLKMNLVGGGTANFVPEDEAIDYVEIKPHEFTQNGTFNPSDFNADGFGQVKVNVPQQAGTLIEKSITENGVYNPADDQADGYSKVTVNVPGGGGGGAEWVDFTQTAQATITPTTEAQSAAQVVKCEYLYDKDRYVFYFRIYIDYGTDSGLNYNVSFHVPSMQGLDGLVGVDAQFATVYSGGSITVSNGVVSFTTTEVIQHCYCLDMSMNVIVYTNKELVWIYGRNPRRITKVGYEPACLCCFQTLNDYGNPVLDEIIVQNSADYSAYNDLSNYSCIDSALCMLHGDKILYYMITKHVAADLKNQTDLKRRMYIDGWETGGIEDVPLQNASSQSIPYVGNEYFWDYCFAKLGGTPAPSADAATLNSLSATINNRFYFTQSIGDKEELNGRWFQRGEAGRSVFAMLTFTNSSYWAYCIFTKENVQPQGTSEGQWGALVYAGVLVTPSGNTLYVWRMNGCWDWSSAANFTVNGTTVQTPGVGDKTVPYILSNDTAKTCTIDCNDKSKIAVAGLILDLAMFSE